MSYNIKKISREWGRQRSLHQSWQHINNGLVRLENKNGHQAKYVIQWCKQELVYLRMLNAGGSWNKPQTAVLLLMRRLEGGKDSLSYNMQQLKIQSSSYL